MWTQHYNEILRVPYAAELRDELVAAGNGYLLYALATGGREIALAAGIETALANDLPLLVVEKPFLGEMMRDLIAHDAPQLEASVVSPEWVARRAETVEHHGVLVFQDERLSPHTRKGAGMQRLADMATHVFASRHPWSLPQLRLNIPVRTIERASLLASAHASVTPKGNAVDPE